MFLVVCIVFGLSSCSKDDEYISPLKGITFENLEFNYQEDLKEITFSNINLEDYKVNTSKTWCLAGVINGKLAVMVLENRKMETRESEVSLTDPKDGTMVSFKVIQKERIVINIDNSEYNVPEEGGQIKIDISSNANYQVEIKDDWITLGNSSTRALVSSLIVINVSKNDSGDSREAIVNLKDTETNTTSSIKIKQSFTPYLTLEHQDITFDENGGEYDISVKSNFKFETVSEYSWAEVIGEKTIDDNSTSIRIKISPITDNTRIRYNTIFFKHKNGEIINSLNISQKDLLYITSSNIEILMGESYKISYSNSTGEELSWKSSDESIFTIDKNGLLTGVAEGTSTISVSTKDGLHSDKITLSCLKDLNSKLSYSWTTSSIVVGAWSQVSYGCELKNNSTRSIILTKCSIYGDGAYINSTTDKELLGTLNSGETKGISISNLRSGIKVLKFVWDYSVGGKTYTFECSRNMD